MVKKQRVFLEFLRKRAAKHTYNYLKFYPAPAYVASNTGLAHPASWPGLLYVRAFAL